VLSFDRLVGVRVGSHSHGPAGVFGHTQSFFEQRGCISFGKQPGFKIETWRQTQIRMRWSRKTVVASMFAAPVWIYGAVERHTRGRVASDDCSAAISENLGAQWGRKCV
jgi:hypothetical protein